MAKLSRMSKYKDLRESVKTSADINVTHPNVEKQPNIKEPINIDLEPKPNVNVEQQPNINVDSTPNMDVEPQPAVQSFFEEPQVKETPKVNIQPQTDKNDDEEFDFMKAFSDFEASRNQSTPFANDEPVTEDTLIEPLTFDKINEQVDEELERALNRVRANIGQEDYDTRMDILNKIRKASDVFETVSDEDFELANQIEAENTRMNNEANNNTFQPLPTNPVIEEEEDEYEEAYEEERQSFFSKFRNSNVEDDLDSTDEYDDSFDEDIKPMASDTKVYNSDYDDDEDYDDYDDDEESSPLVIKILNGIIIVLVIVLIVIIGFFVKTFIL